MPASNTDHSASPSSQPPAKRSRRNVTEACVNCRERKKKCDGVLPSCGTCTYLKDDCVWGHTDRRKPMSRVEASALQRRVDELEGLVDMYRRQVNELRPRQDNAPVPHPPDLLFHNPTSAFHHAGVEPPHAPTRAWARFLPDVYLTKEQHDAAVDRFGRYFSCYGQRFTPHLFARDAEVATTLAESEIATQAPNYSPMLHNVVLSLGLAYAKEEHLRAIVTRCKFHEEASRRLAGELAAPSLATAQALALRSSFSSTVGDYSVGWINNGLTIRLCYALGLHVDTENLLKGGRLTQEEYCQRSVTFWSCFCQETMWAIYIGRTPLMGDYEDVPMPQVDPGTDNELWAWPAGRMKNCPPQKSYLSSAFVETTKLLRIATKCANTIYSGRIAKSALVADGTVMRLSDQLDTWLNGLPDVLRPTFSIDVPTLPHLIILHMSCSWIAILLFQPFSQIVSNEDFGKYAMTRCHAAAIQIHTLAILYDSQHGLPNSPPTLAQILYTAGSTFLLAAAQAQLPSYAAAALEKVHACLRMLRSIGETWNASTHKAAILERLLGQYGEASTEAPVLSDHISVWSETQAGLLPAATPSTEPDMPELWYGDESLDEFIRHLFSQNMLPMGDGDLASRQWPLPAGDPSA